MSNLRQAHKTDPSLRHVQNKKTPNVWALHKVQQNQDRARLLQALSLSPEDLEKTNWITKAHMDPLNCGLHIASQQAQDHVEWQSCQNGNTPERGLPLMMMNLGWR